MWICGAYAMRLIPCKGTTGLNVVQLCYGSNSSSWRQLCLRGHTCSVIAVSSTVDIQSCTRSQCRLQATTSIIKPATCANDCVVECRTCNREVAGSNLGRAASHRGLLSLPSLWGSVNEYRLRLGRQRQVWLITVADTTQGVQVKL